MWLSGVKMWNFWGIKNSRKSTLKCGHFKPAQCSPILMETVQLLQLACLGALLSRLQP